MRTIHADLQIPLGELSSVARAGCAPICQRLQPHLQGRPLHPQTSPGGRSWAVRTDRSPPALRASLWVGRASSLLWANGASVGQLHMRSICHVAEVKMGKSYFSLPVLFVSLPLPSLSPLPTKSVSFVIFGLKNFQLTSRLQKSS